MNAHSKVLAPLIMISCLWGAANLMIKLVLVDFSAPALSMYRWIIVSVIMWFLLSKPTFRSFINVKLPAKKDAFHAIMIGLFCVGPGHSFLYFGLLKTSSIEGTALNTSGPIWAALLAIFILGERLNAQRWLSIGLGFIGSYILTMGFGLPEFKESSSVGNMIYLVGVILEMLGMVLAKKVILRSSGMGTVAWQVVGMAIWSVLLPFVLPDMFPVVVHHIGLSSLVAFAYLVLVSGVLCFTAWYKIAENTPVSFMALVLALEPLVAALLGSLFLQEPLTFELWIGIVLVLAAVGIAAIEKPLRRVTVRKVPKYQAQEHEYRNNYDQERRIELGSVFHVAGEEPAD